MIKVIRINERAISVNGNQLEFDQSVDEYLVDSDRVIVLLLVDDFKHGDPLVGRNILAYDSEGALLWRIADHRLVIGRDSTPQAFLDIGESGGEIWASTPTVVFNLSPETGEISNPRLNR